jgi:hypothetical protein
VSGNTRTIGLKFTGDIADLVAAVGGADAALNGLKKSSSDTSGFDKLNTSVGEFSKNLSYLPSLIAIAAPLAGGALVAGIGAGLAGGLALIQSNNDDVVASFQSLGSEVVNGLKGITTEAVPNLVDAAHSLGTEFTKVKPQLAEAFSYAEPDIATFTDGLNNMVTNLMPGLVNASKASNTALQGVSVLLGDIGTAGTLALTGLSGGAGKFAGLFGQVGTTVENVGQIIGSVLPAMSGGIGTTLSVVNLLTSGIAAMGPAIGTVAGYIPLVTVGLKGWALASTAASGINDGLTSISNGILNVAANAEKSAPKTSNFLSNIAATTENMAGPFGAAVIGGGVALLGLAAIMGKTAISAADLSQTQANLTAAMTSSNNQLSAATVSALITSQGYKDVQDSAKQAGISQQQLIAAITQGGSAYTDLQAKLQGITNAGVTYTDNGRVATTQTTAQAEASQNLSQGLSQLRGTYSDAANAAQAAAAATQAAAQAAPAASLNSSVLAANVKILSDNTQSASSRLSALSADMKLLGENGKETANDAISALYTALNGLNAQLQGTSGKLLDTSGSFDLTSTKGEQARTTFINLAGQLLDYNQALVNQGTSQDSANQQTQAMIDKMAGPLAKQLGLTVSQVDGLINTYYSVPPGVTTTVTANTAPAQQDLNAFINANQNRTIIIGAGVSGIHASTGNLNLRASGGPVSAGRSYLVGESGYEIFTPSQNGSITSHAGSQSAVGAAQGGDGVTITGDLVFPIDLGSGIQQTIRVTNQQLKQRIKAGTGSRL